MNKEKFIPLTKSFLYINILIWCVANYLLYYFFDNLIILVISIILCFFSAIILIRNRKYLQEYDSNVSVLMSIIGYWFWLLILFTFLLQIKINVHLWFYFIELFALFLVFMYSKKTNSQVREKNNKAIDFKAMEKVPKTVARIAASSLVISSFIHLSLSESQALFILSLFLLFFTLVSFWLFSSLVIVYFKHLTQKDSSSEL